MHQMVVVDESGKALSMLEEMFQNEFVVSSILPGSLEKTCGASSCGPNLVLFLSKGNMDITIPRIERIRHAWPKSVVLLLMPTMHGEEQLGGVFVPAHNILFKPCSKKRVFTFVNNYLSLMREESSAQDCELLSTIVEFVGEQRPSLYVAHNRLRPLIQALCGGLDCDWKHVQKIFTLYIVLLSYVDEEVSDALMQGEGRAAKTMRNLYGHIQKMVDLLGMNSSTRLFSSDLQYVLKRYDGEGVPQDGVKGPDIPVASRVVRLLLDYHYLLQQGKSVGQALFVLHKRTGWYDDTLVQTLIELLGDEGKRSIREVYPLGLVSGMEVAEDVYGVIDEKRRKILSSNEILTDSAIDYLQRHSDDVLDITEPVKVFEDLFSKGDHNA